MANAHTTFNSSAYAQQFKNATQRYTNGQDDSSRYISKCAALILHMAGDAYRAEHPHYNKQVDQAMTIGQPVLEAALETFAHRLSDPSDPKNHETILHEIIRHIRNNVDEELQPIRNFLALIGINT